MLIADMLCSSVSDDAQALGILSGVAAVCLNHHVDPSIEEYKEGGSPAESRWLMPRAPSVHSPTAL